METHQAAAGDEQQICRRHNGKNWRCKNVSGDNPSPMNSNKRKYLTKKYKLMEEHDRSLDLTGIQPPTNFLMEKPSFITSNEMKKKKLPPDEQICSFISDGGKWRCKNFRMSHNRVPKSKYCEKHYNYYAKYYKKRELLKKKKKTSTGDGDQGARSGPIQVTWGSKRRRKMKVTEEEDDDTSDVEGGSANVATKRKNVMEWSGELDFTDFLIEKPSLITSNEMKNEKEIENKKLPPDDQICSFIGDGGKWRCKNFRMSHGAADDPRVPDTKFCEKHYNYYSSYNKTYYYKKKKRSGDGQGAGFSIATGPIEETKGSKRREKVTEEGDETEIQKLGASGDNTSDRIGRKRENAERTERSGDLEALTGIKEPTVELKNLEHYKRKSFQLSVELEKKKVECTTLQGKLAEVEETRKTSVADGTYRTPTDATECWRKLFSDLTGWVESRISDLENIVLRMDNKISTMEGCVESRISKLESLVLRSGKGGSILRCVQLRHSEKIESGAQDSQNDITQNGEKQIDENDRKDSDVYECNTKEKVLNVYNAGSVRVSSEGENVEERKGWGCLKERPSQHGSSSQDHLEMSTEPFVNLVSDDDSVEILGESEDSDNSTDSEGSLGTLMDMLAMKYKNRERRQRQRNKMEV
ncbi:uncharacterized protein LOC113319348 [Papaver somniferum]|uniref:uncharacterized protein LOC113319348 n=1 Tax=Papaver somniferum TaxID=3469 RepID=UPI000E6FB63B|nr:uncharacterized protein LOC113319348 [Papaver somniferum]XP_026423411.1 uncharacterized protein LOC113319348 [Papaver somniferum]